MRGRAMAAVLAATVGTVGCAPQQRTPCKIATAVVGGLVGTGIGTGVAAAVGPDSDKTGVYFAGGAGGAIVGTLVGVGIGALACPQRLPPTPPPPPAPAPAPGTKLGR